jgi:GTP cyclohydrolase FolE2
MIHTTYSIYIEKELLDFQSDDNFTCRVTSLQNFSLVDNKYREAFKNLAETMKRSQKSRVSLKFKFPVKEAARYWEERRESIITVLSSIEISSTHIQQIYFHTIHPTSSLAPHSYSSMHSRPLMRYNASCCIDSTVRTGLGLRHVDMYIQYDRACRL